MGRLTLTMLAQNATWTTVSEEGRLVALGDRRLLD